jgi:hypothetical protein
MTALPNRPLSPPGPSMEVPAGLNSIYANLVRISHTPSELVFDFAHLLPGTSSATIKAQVVMSPLSAKLFFRAMAENLSRYEKTFGEIKVPGEATLADELFKPPNSPEKPDGE